MMKRLDYILAICASAAALASCDKTIHQYPHSVSAMVIVEPHVADDIHYLYKEVTYNENWGCSVRSYPDSTLAREMKLDDDHKRRVVTEIRSGSQTGEGELLRRKESLVDIGQRTPADTVHINLPLGSYNVSSWSDYVGGTRASEYFNVSDLNKVITDTDVYPDNIGFRSSFGGNAPLAIDYDALEYGLRKRVDLDLNKGRFVLVASDYDQYLLMGGTMEDLRVKVIYRQYVNNGYSVAARKPNSFISSYEFTTSAHYAYYGPGEGDAVVSDYLFVDRNRETVVVADFVFYSAYSGKEINHCQGIEIPLRAGKETVIRAYCLTKEYGKGEIAIDENFGGEYIVEI